MSLETTDRPCAICGELVDTNDSDRVTYLDANSPAHRACVDDDEDAPVLATENVRG